VAFIGKQGEPIPDVPPIPTQPRPAVAALPAAPTGQPAAPVPMPVKDAQPAPADGTPASASVIPKQKPISPRARRLLKEYPINPDPIVGTGPGKRVTEKDVLAYLDAKNYHQLRITPTAKILALKEGIDILSLEPTATRITVEMIKRAVAEKPKAMSKIRQIIARRLTRSFTSIPHFYVTVSTDMTALLNFRKELKKVGQAYSVTDFIMKATALALAQFPVVNSTTDGQSIRWHSRVHLGMAVDMKEGLVVPVIRDADIISFDELHARSMRLILKARAGKLLPNEMTGSTFTISNMGMLDVDHFTAIINPGESAILAISSIRETPVVRKDRIVIRSIMAMTLSSDHRLVDGAMAARFAHQIKAYLEDIELWKSMTLS